MNYDDDLYHQFLQSFDSIDDDEDADDMYRPDGNSDDDDDDEMVDIQKETKDPNHFDLKTVLLRFNTQNPLPQEQLFMAALCDQSELPNSPFTVEQWDMTRHQCRLHFGLLCRSIRFVSFCNSSDAILTSLLALLHTFYLVFKTSTETTKNINDLFHNDHLFVPVLGDPATSLILKTEQIINFFVKGGQVDDLIEADFFNEIFDHFPTKGIIKPIYLNPHSPWTKEDDNLLEVAHRRFTRPEDIQRFVMPGRSIVTILDHFRDEWKAENGNAATPSPPPPVLNHDEDDDDDEDDDKPFEVSGNMRFTEVRLHI